MTHVTVSRVTGVITIILITAIASSLLFVKTAQGVSATTTAWNASNSSTTPLKITTKAEKNPATRGSIQTIYITVKAADGKPVKGASVSAVVFYGSSLSSKKFTGYTNNDGIWSCTWQIDEKARVGLAGVDIRASKAEYDTGYGSTVFKVISEK